METLAIAKTLQKIDGIGHDEAYNIAEAINGKLGLATKEDIAEVKADVVWIKWIFGISISLMIAAILFLFTKMDANHKEVNQRIDRLDQKMDGIKELIIQEMRK